MLTKQQLQERRTGIGGSDLAAILNLSKWKTPLQVYMQKRGELPDEDENQFTKWGSILEPVIMQEYEEQTGEKVCRPNSLIRNATYPFMIANLDGIIERKLDSGSRYCKVVEIKTAIQFKANEWGEVNTDELPDYYLTQIHHYMSVVDADEADVAVLIGGNDFRIYNIKRDYEISKMIIERETEFWNMVQNGTPPDITNPEDWLLKYQNTVKDAAIEASEAEFDLLRTLKNTKEQIKTLETLEDTLKNQIMLKLGENKLITTNGNKLGAITIQNRTGWDLDALSTDPELVAKYKTKTSTSAFFQLAKTKNINELLGVK